MKYRMMDGCIRGTSRLLLPMSLTTCRRKRAKSGQRWVLVIRALRFLLVWVMLGSKMCRFRICCVPRTLRRSPSSRERASRWWKGWSVVRLMLQKSNLDMRQMRLGLRKSQIGSSPSPSGQHECRLHFGMICKISGCVKQCHFEPLRPPRHCQAISSRRSLNRFELTYQTIQLVPYLSWKVCLTCHGVGENGPITYARDWLVRYVSNFVCSFFVIFETWGDSAILTPSPTFVSEDIMPEEHRPTREAQRELAAMTPTMLIQFKIMAIIEATYRPTHLMQTNSWATYFEQHILGRRTSLPFGKCMGTVLINWHTGQLQSLWYIAREGWHGNSSIS